MSILGGDTNEPVQPLSLNDLHPVGGSSKASLQVGARIEYYDATKVPLQTSYFVQYSLNRILSNLSLDAVLFDLDRAGDFMFLAYNGVKGVKDIAGNVSDRQTQLLKLCSECLVTMEYFSGATKQILKRITEGFSFVFMGKEPQALMIFSTCSSQATVMSTKCGELSDGFKDLMDKTQLDNTATYNEVGKETEAMKRFRDMQADMQSNLKQAEAEQKELNQNISRLKEDIATETSRQKTESERAFLGDMFKVAAGAFSNSPGGTAQDLSEQKTAPSKSTTTTDTTGKASDKKGNEADGKTDSVDASYDVRLTMIKQKRKLEDSNREQLSKIAELQAKIGNNKTEQGIAEATVAALQVAVFAFGRISAAMKNAKFFWDHMSQFCADLASDKTMSHVKKEVEYGDDVKTRIGYYESDMFLPNAIMYGVRWKALAVLCEQYVQAASAAREKVAANISASPTVEKARELLPQLQAKLQKSISDELARAAVRDAELAKVEEMIKLKQALVGADSASTV